MAAAVSMASSVTAAVLPVSFSQASSFSTATSVRMAAPVKVNRQRLAVVAMATPQGKEGNVQDKVKEAIKEAEETCATDPASANCAVAWDEVEELAAEDAHQRAKKKTNSDPLEAFCGDNPEADECRTYED